MLAKASVHSSCVLSDTLLSRASPLPQRTWAGPNIQEHHQTLWERACSRKRRYIQHLCCLTHRFREQARSHNGLGHDPTSKNTTKPCGSEPAREGVGTSSSALPDTPLSRASSLPQWTWAGPNIQEHNQTPWERACSRKRRHIQHLCCLTHRYREQALPQFFFICEYSIRHCSRRTTMQAR